MTLVQFVSDLIVALRNEGFDKPLSEAELLVSGVLECDRSRLLVEDQRTLSNLELKKLQTARDRRLTGEPLAYILGFKSFYKNRFLVGPGVLIPRPETEMLVEAALNEWPEPLSSFTLADFGAGSGAIGLSILSERPKAHLVAVERSAEALWYLEKNIQALQLTTRVDLWPGRVEEFNSALAFDLVVANPPYIDPGDPDVEAQVHSYEPHGALYSADGGLADCRHWAQVAARVLKPGGLYLMEFGAAQAEKLKSEPWAQWGFSDVSFHQDLSGLNRMVAARRERASIK